jgi:hypothetical protein
MTIIILYSSILQIESDSMLFKAMNDEIENHVVAVWTKVR